MRIWLVVALILALMLIAVPAASAQHSSAAALTAPKYDLATEATFKGTVEEVQDRLCPVSGGTGSHVVLKLADGSTIEVHLATTAWVKMYDLTLNRGDEIEVTGSKVKFEGVDTILARQVKRGADTFVFRDKSGKPVW
jgi:DNA/RNA endonuclease YhcR with UshA esterase domain